MVDRIMGSGGSGDDKGRDPHKNKATDKKEHDHRDIKSKGKDEKDDVHHGGSAKKVSAALGKHSKDPIQVSNEARLAKIQEKLKSVHHQALQVQKELADDIARANKKKLDRIAEIKQGSSYIHTFSHIINLELRTLFLQAQAFPDIVKTLSDIQIAIADLTATVLSRIPTKHPSGISMFNPINTNAMELMKENQWMGFLEGISKILREAGNKQVNLLSNETYKGLLKQAEELHLTPNVEPPSKPHSSEPHLRKK